jgi:sec-independent protein translocase protein TatA
MLTTHSSTRRAWHLAPPDALPQGVAGTVSTVNLGPTELLIILAVVLVLFGGSKLPKLARSLGQAQNEFKKGVQANDDDQDVDKPVA